MVVFTIVWISMAGSQFEGPSCLEATSWPATARTTTLCCGTVLSVSMAAGCWVATLLQSVDVTIDSVDCFFWMGLTNRSEGSSQFVPVCQDLRPHGLTGGKIEKAGFVPQHFGMQWKKMFQGQ